ncbi:MAG TPA: hypothetical protein VFF40_03140 [Acidimicrobiia bacterium]|nr:hypothetical protein [Acidimicrobiia bacterium]
MAKRPDLGKYLDTGAQFVALTRTQARARAKELVGTGHLAQGQVQAFVDDLVDESRRRTDEMLDVVRGEIQRQMKSLGLATKGDLARLEARVQADRKKPAKKKVTKGSSSATSKKRSSASAKKPKATTSATRKRATSTKKSADSSNGARPGSS